MKRSTPPDRVAVTSSRPIRARVHCPRPRAHAGHTSGALVSHTVRNLVLRASVVALLGGLRAAEAQAVPAPTPGAIEPCITRVELHKATMARQLLLIGFTGFFLGVCFCSCCVGALWCLLSVVSWSPEDGVTNRVHTDRCDSLFQRARPTTPLRGAARWPAQASRVRDARATADRTRGCGIRARREGGQHGGGALRAGSGAFPPRCHTKLIAA